MDGKKFKVLFFQVNTLQNPRNFEDFLKNLQRLPDVNGLQKEVSGWTMSCLIPKSMSGMVL